MNLLFDSVEQPSCPAALPALARDLPYPSVWQTVLELSAFNFLLIDYSLIQLRLDATGHDWGSFAFYHCPHDTMSFHEFCSSMRALEDRIPTAHLKQWYREHVPTTPIRASAVPIRYDVDYDAFEAGRHPAAHLHIGHNTPLRIATARAWRPLTFVGFVARQFYCKQWQRFYKTHPKHKIFRMVRDSLPELQPDFFDGLAGLECRLS